MEVTPIIAAVGAVASAVFMKQNADAQRKAEKAQYRSNQRQYQLETEQARLALAEEQRKNRNLLAQQQSAYRAKLGASGLGAKSGSGQVVLNSLKKEADAEDKYLVNQANISLEALLNGINAKNTRNLLNLSSLNAQRTANTVNALSGFTSTAGRTILK